jgi:hypothetical protein
MPPASRKNLLKEWGYEFFLVEQNGSLTGLNSPRVGNILAIPRNKDLKSNEL